MTERLQPFDYAASPYHRPNQHWVCGRQADGSCCHAGPDARGHCGAGPQCQPVRDGDRWRCTRGPLQGGPCAGGPAADGRCCQQEPPCRPRRSWKYRRKLLVRSTAVAALGLVLLGLAGQWAGELVEPGHLSAAHSTVQACSDCHTTAGDEAGGWLQAAWNGGADMPVGGEHACLNCHDLGETPQAPHGLQALPTGEPGDRLGPWSVELNRAIWGAPEAPVSCGACHQEHQGAMADLTAVEAGQCQVCHSQRFPHFGDGHPEFSDYPYDRRTRIVFDHASHLGKHFADEADAAPASCSGCHVPAEDGRTMRVRAFDTSCGGCHAGDIAGDSQAGARGLAVLAVPGFDLTLVEQIGQWPAFADGELPPMNQWLLAAVPNYAELQARLEDVDLLDLEAATASQRDAASELAWHFKHLIHDLQQRGSAEFIERLEASQQAPLDTTAQRRLSGLLPIGLIDAAQQRWFPDLASEVAAHQDGEPPATTALRPEPADTPEATSDDDGLDDFDALFGGGDDDESLGDLFADDAGADEDLFGGDLFAGGDDVDPFAEPEPTPEPESEPGLSPEERMALGGWYLDDFVLRYRPAGHADPVLRAWTDLAAGQAGGDWMDPRQPGMCLQCHSVERDGPEAPRQVQWQPRQVSAQLRQFTEFDHAAHFSLLGDAGCRTCHEVAPDAAYAESFETLNPHDFASNFQPLEQAVCLECHQPDQAGDDCTQCHRYHVGEFEATLPPTQMSALPARP